MTKLTDAMRRTIAERWHDTRTADLAAIFGVSQSTVREWAIQLGIHQTGESCRRHLRPRMHDHLKDVDPISDELSEIASRPEKQGDTSLLEEEVDRVKREILVARARNGGGRLTSLEPWEDRLNGLPRQLMADDQ